MAMKLLTKALRDEFARTGSQEKAGDDARVICKFFAPDSSWTWYATSFDGADTFWGLVDGFEVEFGPWSLAEMEAATGPLRLHIERDLHWTPKTVREVREEIERRRR